MMSLTLDQFQLFMLHWMILTILICTALKNLYFVILFTLH